MNSLPNPKQFTTMKSSDLLANRDATKDTKNYDLEKIHNTFKRAIEKVDRRILVQKGNELVDYHFYLSTPYPAAAKDLFGWSPKDQSETIHLMDKEGKVRTVAIRRSGNIKWKTFGSKKYCPYDIKDDYIFLFSGMAELVIIKMLGLSYVMLQSDGMVKHLPLELKSMAANKVVVVLQDNDDSFKNIVPEIIDFFHSSEIIIIDFEELLGRSLKKGYDFRDFCNEVKDVTKVMNLIEKHIIYKQEKLYARKS